MILFAHVLTYELGKWKDPENRKRFFESVAAMYNFDPTDPQKWEALNYSDIVKKKGGFRVLQYHKGSHLVALTDLFPELGFSYDSPQSMTRVSPAKKLTSPKVDGAIVT